MNMIQLIEFIVVAICLPILFIYDWVTSAYWDYKIYKKITWSVIRKGILYLGMFMLMAMVFYSVFQTI